MLKGGISQSRNKGLFKMFNLIGLGEHSGSGVPDIYQAWRDAGLDDPIVEEKFGDGDPDRTILTLPLTSSALNLGTDIGTGGYDGDEDKGTKLLLFCAVPRTKAEIQEHLGIKPERYVRQKLLSPLLNDGRLVRTIPDKPKSKNQKYVAAKIQVEE